MYRKQEVRMEVYEALLLEVRNSNQVFLHRCAVYIIQIYLPPTRETVLRTAAAFHPRAEHSLPSFPSLVFVCTTQYAMHSHMYGVSRPHLTDDSNLWPQIDGLRYYVVCFVPLHSKPTGGLARC